MTAEHQCVNSADKCCPRRSKMRFRAVQMQAPGDALVRDASNVNCYNNCIAYSCKLSSPLMVFLILSQMQASFNPSATTSRRGLKESVSERDGDVSLAKLKAHLCRSIPVSTLRLATDVPLGQNSALRATLRTDTSSASCACHTCSARKTVGDLMLPQGQRPGLVLTHLHFAGGKILQKYYRVVAQVSDAVVHQNAITVTGREKRIARTSRTQVMELSLWQREKGPMDDFIQVNSLADPNTEANVTRFSLDYWVAISVVGGLIVIFSVCITCTVLEQYRPDGTFL